jgi:CheY-like chemotaxis protein
LLEELFQYYKQELKVRNKENVLMVYNKYSDEELTIHTDPFRLRQVLTNLISNAVKFTDMGKIEFGFTIVDGNLLFSVKDTGIGISEEYLQQVFERFTQVDVSHSRKFGGTGLGLTISRNIIELLNGKIWVESELNKGSSFYFTIPADIIEEQVDEQTDKSSEKLEFYWENKTILVAEDDDFNFMFIEEMLIPCGIKIIRAKNGKEAVDLVFKIPEISLVLMDIQMPVMDGYESTRLIKRLKPELPVIAQTAYALATEREMSFRAGCVDYITKPLDQQKLLLKINKFS